MSEGFPGERSSTSSDDVAGHGAEFVEREFRDVMEGVSDYAYPESVLVRGGLVGFSGQGGVASK